MKRSPLTRTLMATILAAFAGASAVQATETVRELWDGVGKSVVGASTTMAGFGDGTTSLGFAPGSVWMNQSSIVTNALVQCDINFDDFAGIGLPSQIFSPGALWSDVFWGTSDVSAAIPYNSPSNWVARMLAPGAQIDFNANGTYYFSADVNHGGNSAGGVAFASGTGPADHFAGIGITWGSYPQLNSGLDAGNSDYICAGTFSDISDTNTTLPEAQGLFAIKSYSTSVANAVAGQVLLVGRIVTSVGGNTEVDVKYYNSSSTLDTDPSTVVWDASYNFTETNLMKYLVIFMNTENPSNPYFEQGAHRVATTWGEVVGVESLISISPTNMVPTGQPVTLSSVANLAPLTYQWTLNGTNIPNATNATYNVASPAAGDAGHYSLILSNAYGMSTNNPGIQLTVAPPAPPLFVTQPALPATRYTTAPLSLTPFISGSPPFTYQWFQGNTPLTTQTNLTLSIPSLVASNAGFYHLFVSSPYGSTNSATNLLTVISPTGFDAAVVANQPFAYWRLDETNGAVLHDFYAGNDGIAPDASAYQGYNAANNSFGVPGPSYAGFAAGSSAIGTIQGNAFSSLKVPAPTTFGNMTIVIWVNFGANYPGGDTGIFTYRDLTSGGGYGNIYGIQTSDGAGQVGWSWNNLNDYNGASTGLVAPTNQWNFMALEIDPAGANMYVGDSTVPLSQVLDVNSVGLETNSTPATFTTYVVPAGLIDIGNANYPFAQGGGSTQMTAAFRDAAIFNSSLTYSQILKLYAAGVGLNIQATPNGPGSLMLNWIQGGTLQQSTSAGGHYTDVVGATSPFPVSTTNGTMFYRVKL